MALETLHGIPIITHTSDVDRAFLRAGDTGHTGYDPDSYLPEMHLAPSGMELIPESEYRDRIKQQWADGSGLIQQYLNDKDWNGENLDQNGQGLCHSYGVTHAMMLLRMRDGLPFKRLSGHGLGCMVTGFRDQGSWCGMAAKKAMEFGCPSVEFWTEKSMSRANDTPEMREDAAKNRIAAQWYDLSRREWDQPLLERQRFTQLLLNNPVPADYMVIGHTMCGIGLGLHDSGEILPCVLNSWKGWGYKGLGFLRGPQWNPKSSVAPFAVAASD